MENTNNNRLNILIIAIIFVFAVNVGIITASKKTLKEKTDAAEEANRPANISLTIIKDSSCSDCADIAPIINAIKKTNSKIIGEETFEAADPEAQKLIGEFGIKKLPTFIIKGEVNKNEDVKKLLSQVGEVKDNTFKFNYFLAPYFDLTSNSIKGKVKVTFVTDKSCAECYDINPFKQILAGNLGMANPDIAALDQSEKEAQSLIKKYKIEAIPAFVLTGEISEYPKLAGIWLQIGALEKDGAYVLRDIKKVNPNLVYRDLKTGKVVKPAAATPVPSPVATLTPAPK